MDKTGIIILAAGASTRMGSPKQLLEYQGKSLLQHVIDEAKATEASAIVVVLGSNHDLISENTVLDGAEVVINEQWKTGMASSIRAGVEALTRRLDVERAFLSLCDQPHLDRDLIIRMVQQQKNSKKSIVACCYEGIVGVPAVFSRSMFSDLLSLQGQEGAKKLITKRPEVLETIDFPKGVIDIDTPSDYENLKYWDKSGLGKT